ncbi:glycerophosphoryl diester phosphodiesterase [Pararhizobium capsulatum DSM 1112]|uniref:Glycerophosphoryl diester phosphodiesterase n=1 Tax=Pararhizobium capsulatum DSM 1112 TaxID=1121113 RepID=A0ABU0BTJ9_9HYPH|nr:glycerophosphodiester phosphodiesterase family protein [Pararhizobium capsulatum]MDQ0321569.1 glycerophosphoryl diester phosphodiesterase [Pararhizobium capsulatum DSM 1112]
MRRMLAIATVSLFALCGIATHALNVQAADTSRARLILDRFTNANHWRQHVMVVAHRTGWKENGVTILPENSRAAIRHSIELGAEMVELDVRKSADGRLVVMHDSWLDRTTTCRGEVDTFTLAELRKCHLVVEGSGAVSDEIVPTLSEMFAVAKDQILVNIDNKLGPEILPDVAAEARAIGVAHQIVMKENLWSAKRIDEARAVMNTVGDDVIFMPILADDAIDDAAFMNRATEAFSAPAAELINWHKDNAPLTDKGGPLFSAKAHAAAINGNWHMWANTYPIVNRPPGMLAGGRGDELAVRENRPEESYGFWIDRGVTILQTDEPKAAIHWLETNGYRIPYDLTN